MAAEDERRRIQEIEEEELRRAIKMSLIDQGHPSEQPKKEETLTKEKKKIILQIIEKE